MNRIVNYLIVLTPFFACSQQPGAEKFVDSELQSEGLDVPELLSGQNSCNMDEQHLAGQIICRDVSKRTGQVVFKAIKICFSEESRGHWSDRPVSTGYHFVEANRDFFVTGDVEMSPFGFEIGMYKGQGTIASPFLDTSVNMTLDPWGATTVSFGSGDAILQGTCRRFNQDSLLKGSNTREVTNASPKVSLDFWETIVGVESEAYIFSPKRTVVADPGFSINPTISSTNPRTVELQVNGQFDESTERYYMVIFRVETANGRRDAEVYLKKPGTVIGVPNDDELAPLESGVLNGTVDETDGSRYIISSPEGKLTGADIDYLDFLTQDQSLVSGAGTMELMAGINDEMLTNDGVIVLQVETLKKHNVRYIDYLETELDLNSLYE